MSLTYAAQPTDGSVRKSAAIVVVVLVHVGFLYAFIQGLNVIDIVQPLKATVAVFIPDQTPPPESPPVPEPKPLEVPIDTMTAETSPPLPMEIVPDMSVPVNTGESAISIEAPAADPAPPARSFSIMHRVDPPYPAASRRAGESGTVLLSVVVGPNGAPTEINVERSSGYAALDQAAVAAVRRWRFAVISDSSYSRLRLPITFKLEN